MQEQTFRFELAGRPLEVVVGKYALLSDATVLISYSDTQVMVHATSAKPREGIDFFPLSCDYQEKLYAVGRIPGGYLKREGRPSDKATLASRLMDRPIRPLFPEGYKNDIQVIAEVLSIDRTCAPEIVAMIGSSIVLSLAEEIPFLGPTGTVQIGMKDGEFLINPTEEELNDSALRLVVSGTKDAVMMVDAQADIVSEETMLQAIFLAHEEIKKIVRFIEEIVEAVGVAKKPFEAQEKDSDLLSFINEMAEEDVGRILHEAFEKEQRQEQLDALYEEILEAYSERTVEEELDIDALAAGFKALQKRIMRAMILNEGVRPDGRAADAIRPLYSETGIIRRTHGSGYFKRGMTSALSITTLGALGDAQRLDGLEMDENKRFMHQYNFPHYSVGETGPLRGPNRRAIGHGALGEKALLAVLPSEDEFPYAIRVVSEVLSSNGSSSQASICASSLSMMDAGIPLKAPVAGIAMGLIKEGEKIAVLSDIQGLEDFLGDMDFKIAGTAEGISAIQMDMKIGGIDRFIFERALEQARVGRLHILESMNATLSEPRELSPHAPRVFVLWINPDKIRDVIGTGGKVITRITNEHNAKIDITDDGRIVITAETAEGGEAAKAEIEAITKDVEVGEVYDAKIVRIAKFGAFVALTPHHEALCHISEMAPGRLDKVEDLFKEGDVIKVKVTAIDEEGKIACSRKVLLEDDHKKATMERIKEVKLGDIYTAKILRIAKFGAFVEILPGIDALCHISELTLKHLRRVEDEFSIGDEIVVKVINIDGEKIGVSRKALLDEMTSGHEG